MDTATLLYMELRPQEVILLMLKIATNLIGVSFLIPSGNWHATCSVLWQILTAAILQLDQ